MVTVLHELKSETLKIYILCLLGFSTPPCRGPKKKEWGVDFFTRVPPIQYLVFDFVKSSTFHLKNVSREIDLEEEAALLGA